MLTTGTSPSSEASWAVVRARSPRNAFTIRSRTGCNSRSALATRPSYPTDIASDIVRIYEIKAGHQSAGRPQAATAGPSEATPLSPQTAAIVGSVLFLLLAFAFDLYCLRDLRETPAVYVFPREAWFYIIILATPIGGMTYLTI